MISGSALAVYVAAAAALAVVPGPAVLYIVSQSVYGGRRVGVLSALGVASGGLVHVVAAVLGLSALVVASAEAFTVVKVVGAVYLVVLGIRALRAREGEIGGRRHEPRPWHAYRQGAIVNILNPKTALFFLAFLPQFVDSHHPVRPQLALLGGLFLVIALSSDLVWALVAGTAGHVLRRSRAFLRAQRYVSGTVFIGLGVLAAVTGHHRVKA